MQLVEATGRKILASIVDVGDAEGLRQAVDDGVAALSRLDVIVANAGTCDIVMAGAQKVILISSGAGIKMQPFMMHYTASKRATNGMARTFAAELGRHSIRVNSQWRLVFRWDGSRGEASGVYLDDHSYR